MNKDNKFGREGFVINSQALKSEGENLKTVTIQPNQLFSLTFFPKVNFSSPSSPKTKKTIKTLVSECWKLEA